MRAVGSPELIRDMRRGYVTSVEKFRALCEVLDLEFYVGQRREEVPVDEDRLAVALETAHEGLEDGGGALDAAGQARLVIAVYALVGRGGRVPNAERVRELIRAARGGGEVGAQLRVLSGPRRHVRLSLVGLLCTALALVTWRTEYEGGEYELARSRLFGAGLVVRGDVFDRLVNAAQGRLTFRDFLDGSSNLCG